MILLLLACNGADPTWDLYPLHSYALADLPRPRMMIRLSPAELTVAPEGDLPCPIPLASAISGDVGGVPMVLRPGSVHGTGLGSACIPSALVVPRDRIPSGNLAIRVTDGVSTWHVTLSDPLAERALIATPTADGFSVAIRPASDRWVPSDVPAALVLTTSRPAPSCTTEVEAPIPEVPPDPLIVPVPDDFCPGPAFLALGSSLQRSAVLACEAGVSCRFDPGGFVTEVEVPTR